MICKSCGATVTEPGKKCPACGHRQNFRARKQQESEALADQIASSSPKIGYSAWQRSVIMNVVDGGGVAGLLLVLSSVIVCCVAFIVAHRMIGEFKHEDGTPYSGGALFYISLVVPIAALYFRLAAPLFYRLHVRLSQRRDA